MAMDGIVTNFWAKPIPLRQFDWCATYENDEPNDNGQMAQGFGRTESDAVLDLIDNHPRGVWCERDRRCGDCVHYHEVAVPFDDDPYRTDTRCVRWDRFVYSTDTCAEHYFCGGEPQQRTILPIETHIPF